MRRRKARLVRPTFSSAARPGVERDDAAGVERGLGVVQLVEVGVRHREGGAVLLDLAVERQSVAVAELAADVLPAAKPDGLERAAALVHDLELETHLSALPDLALARDRAHDHDGLGPTFHDLADRCDGAPVEVAARVVAQQVAERSDAHLPQRLGAALAHAGEFLDVGIENGRGGGEGGHARNYRCPLTACVTARGSSRRRAEHDRSPVRPHDPIREDLNDDRGRNDPIEVSTHLGIVIHGVVSASLSRSRVVWLTPAATAALPRAPHGSIRLLPRFPFQPSLYPVAPLAPVLMRIFS